MNNFKTTSILAMVSISLGIVTSCVIWLESVSFVRHVSWILIIGCTTKAAWLCSRTIFPSRSNAFYVFTTSLLFQIFASLIVSYSGFIGFLTTPIELVLSGSLLFLSALALRSSTVPPAPTMNVTLFISEPIVVASCITAAVSLSVTAFNYFRYPTQDSDNMWYHLPMVAEWMRSSSIWPDEASPIRLVAIGYPGFRESILTFLAIPFHNEHLGILGVFEPFIFCGAVFFLGWELTKSYSISITTATYAATVPMVVGANKGNDLSLAIWITCSVLYLWEFIKERSSGRAVVAGFCLGSVAATKYSGVIFAPLTLFACLAPLLARNILTQRDRWCKRDAGYLLYIAAAAIVVSFPWYGRNALLWGNPLYPAELEILGIRIFDGPMTREMLARTTLGWQIGPLISHWRHFIDAFGWLVPLLGLGAIHAAANALRSIKTGRLLITTVGILACLLFVAFLHQPYNKPSFGYSYNMRYLLPCFALSVVASVTILRRGISDYVIMVVLTIATFFSIAEWTRYWWLIFSCAGLSFAIAVVLKKTSWSKINENSLVLWGMRSLGLACMLGLPLMVSSQQMAINYIDYPSSRGWGDVCNYVHKSVSSERIVVVGDDRFFPLYGNHFSNSIVLLRGRPSASKVIQAAVNSDATMIVTFVPIANRSSQSGYEFEQSLGTALINEFPKKVAVIFESKGAFVLKLSNNDAMPDVPQVSKTRL